MRKKSFVVIQKIKRNLRKFHLLSDLRLHMYVYQVKLLFNINKIGAVAQPLRYRISVE